MIVWQLKYNCMKISKKYPFVYETPMRWGEMDALGHLNNTIYFRYSEEARIQLFNESAINVRLEDPVGPILAFIDCQFLLPVIYPDRLIFGTWIQKIGITSMHVYHDIYSEEHNRIVAQMKSVIVMITYETGEKVTISDELRRAIEARQADFDLGAIDR